MSGQDERLEKIERGRAAAIAEALVGDIIDEHVNMCVSHLIQMYRGGDINHDQMVGKVAEMAAMQHLSTELESRQRQGNMAAQREYGNAETQNSS